MAIQRITYDDKVAINNDTSVPDINKCKADDLNEIKSVVNNNSYETPKVSSQVDTNYKVNVLTTKNLFDINEANIENGYIDTAGMILITSQLNRLFYIPCKPNTTYTISRSITTGTFRVATYDSTPFPSATSTSSTYSISGLIKDNSATSITITTGANAKYLIVHYGRVETDTNIEESLATIQVEYGSQATTYEPFIPNTINVNNEKYTDTINVGATINDKNKVNILYSKNLFDKDNAVVLDLYFDDNDVLQASSYNKLIYIPCKPNTTYTLQKAASPATRQIGYTTEYPAVNVQAYGKVVIATNGTTGTITTGANAKYLIFRFYQTSQDTSVTIPQMLSSIQIQYGGEATIYEPYITPSINIDGEEIYNANLMNYSTNEVVVGKWVDGRNIYRKVVSGTTTSTFNTWGTLTTINNLDIVTKIDFNVFVADNEKYTNNMHNINFYNDGTNLKFRPTTDYWTNKQITAIIEYTKTTD